MNRAKLNIFILAAFLLNISLVCAQDLSVRAFVSKNTIGPDEQFRYSIEISGQSTSLPDPTLPDLADFYVLSGPNQSTNIQWVNGKMSSTKTLTYYLQARKTGKLKIGKVLLTADGKTYSSNEITLTVSKTAASQQKKAPARQGQNRRSQQNADIAGESLFLKTNISKRNVYLGEQIIVEYKLYFKVNVRGYDLEKLPAYSGFWNEDFKMPARPVIDNEVINGINYNVATLKKIALFPTQTGEQTIDPLNVRIEAEVRQKRSRRSLFDSFFDDPFGRTVQKTIIAKPIKINVKPLPANGKPAGFKGAVGNFNFSSTVDKAQVKVNEAISLKLRISGTGNIKLAEIPEVQIPGDIEQYDPKISTSVKNDGQSISGSKTAEFILIPRLAGEYQIKPITLSYFDPQAKRYKSITTKPIELNIQPGSGGTVAVNQSGAGFSRQEVALLGQDIRFIKEFSTFAVIGIQPYRSYQFWIVIFAALFLFAAFVFFNDQQARLSGDAVLARQRKAGKLASKQLAAAKSLMAAGDQSEFYKAISTALQGFVLDKLNLQLTDFSAVNVEQVLQKRGISQDEIKEYRTILEESDFRQFANITASEAERTEHFEKTKTVLTKLEKWI